MELELEYECGENTYVCKNKLEFRHLLTAFKNALPNIFSWKQTQSFSIFMLVLEDLFSLQGEELAKALRTVDVGKYGKKVPHRFSHSFLLNIRRVNATILGNLDLVEIICSFFRLELQVRSNETKSVAGSNSPLSNSHYSSSSQQQLRDSSDSPLPVKKSKKLKGRGQNRTYGSMPTFKPGLHSVPPVEEQPPDHLLEDEGEQEATEENKPTATEKNVLALGTTVGHVNIMLPPPKPRV